MSALAVMGKAIALITRAEAKERKEMIVMNLSSKGESDTFTLRPVTGLFEGIQVQFRNR
jgi:hypothetical protein